MENVIKTDKHPIIVKYFLLPLYDIYSKTLEDKFILAYLNKDRSMLFLKLKEEHDFSDNALYQGRCNIKDTNYYIFSTCVSMSVDIDKVIEGKYSKLSKFAKSKIVNLSGLDYLKVKSDGVYTSYPLMALFKSKFPEWRSILEKRINVILPDESELLSILDNKRIFIEDL